MLRLIFKTSRRAWAPSSRTSLFANDKNSSCSNVFVAQWDPRVLMCSGIRSVLRIDSDKSWFGMFEKRGLSAVGECRASLKLKNALKRKNGQCFIFEIFRIRGQQELLVTSSIRTYALDLHREDFHRELNVSVKCCFSSRDIGPLRDLLQQ